MDIFETLDSICEEVVNLVTLGQIGAINEMYQYWLASAPYYEPNLLGYFFATFIVLLRFIVPVVLVYYFGIRVIFKKPLFRIIAVVAFAVLYALFYFDPIVIFEQAAISMTYFYHFLLDLPSLSYEPFLFTFLTNGAVIFAIRAVVVFVTMWIFFMILLGMGTVLFWVAAAGKSVWDYSDKNFKALTLQLTIVFLIFYPFVGALRAFMTVLTMVIAGVNLKDALYAMRGYQKVCYSTADGRVECKWAR